MTKEDFLTKMKNKFPDENYKVLQFGKNSYEDSEIKCLDCGRHIIVNTGELFRKRRKHICSKCHYLRKDTEQNRQIISDYLLSFNITKFEFYMSGNEIRHDNVRFTCPKCNKVNNIRVANLIRTLNKVYPCSYCSGKKALKDNDIFKKELEAIAPNKFTILVEYTTAKQDIRVKCNNCGFIRNVKPSALIHNPFCPKCNPTKSSLGEQVITNYLTNKNIYFEKNKYFREWNIGIHYYDFYIPEYNLIIEYNGIQHEQFNPFFYKDEKDFEYRKNKDVLKREQAILHDFTFVEINYREYKNLPIILDCLLNSTTIPQGSRVQVYSKKKPSQRDEDIV